eukprot:gene2997-5007_t
MVRKIVQKETSEEREIKIIKDDDEIRRITFEGDSYDTFINSLTDYFELSNLQEEYELFYKDEEDDFIKISTEKEFHLSLKNQKNSSLLNFSNELEISESIKQKLETKALKLMKKEEKKDFKKDKIQKKGRKFMCRFVCHKTIKDNTSLPPKCPFTKIWTLRNESNDDWNDCKLIFIGGDAIEGAKESSLIKVVKPNEEVDISINFISPAEKGHYCGYWKMVDSTNRKFGQRLWIKINVE